MSASLSFFGVLVLNLLLVVYSQWAFNPPKSEGIECGRRGAEVWTCRREAQCPGLRKLMQNGNRVICSKKGGVMTVCCPPSPPVTSISQKKCLEYQGSATCISRPNVLLGSNDGPKPPPFPDAVPEESITELTEEDYVLEPNVGHAPLGTTNTGQPEETLEEDFTDAPGGPDVTTPVLGILGGEEALPGEHPHMALIGYGTTNIRWECGGTLISERFVVSAAHCETSNIGPATVVRLGDLDYNSPEGDENAQQYQIVDRYLHPSYNKPDFYNDIILYKLEQEVFFTKFVAPACLHQGTPVNLFTATGFGKVEPQRKTSILMKVNVSPFRTDTCTEIYNSKVRNPNLRSGVDAQTMICAMDEGKDTCGGDSGGPLVVANKGDNCLYHLAGITSFGPSICEPSDIPGVYVKVQSFIPWIESIVWANEA